MTEVSSKEKDLGSVSFVKRSGTKNSNTLEQSVKAMKRKNAILNVKDSRTVSSKKCSDKKTVPEENTVKATEEGNIISKVEDLCYVSWKETVPEEQVVDVAEVATGWTTSGKKRTFDKKKDKQPVIRE